MENQKRIVFLDYVRAVACMMVLIVHSCEPFYSFTDESGTLCAGVGDELTRLWVSVFDGSCRVAVPLFFIVSAFLLVPMKEGESMWTFYKRRFLRVLPPFLLFCVLYAVVPMWMGYITAEQALADISYLPFNFPSMGGHLWFVYPLIGIYLFIPIISPWLRISSRKAELFFITVFALSTCMPYLNKFVGEVWGQCFWNQFHTLWYFSGFLGYVVVAHYIHKHINWSSARRIAVGLALVVVGTTVTIGSFYLQAVPGEIMSVPEIELGWEFCTLNCLLATTGCFLILSCIKRPSAIITDISKMSYGMYLCHMIYLTPILIYFRDSLGLPSGVVIVLTAICSYICSYCAIKLLSFLPASKYLVGAHSTLKGR